MGKQPHPWSPHEAILGPRIPSRFAVVNWVYSLGECYGFRFLWMLVCSQCLLKGFCAAYAGVAADFVFRSQHVAGPKLQVYKAVAMLPWCFKPVVGVLSDNFPIFGYKKRYYILIVSFLGVIGFCTIGLSKNLTPTHMVAAMTLISLQISACDLLTEAKYAEKMREKPDRGPELMSLLHGGMTVTGLIAHGTIGLVIEHLGPHAAYTCCIPFAVCIIAPTMANFLQEEIVSVDEARRSSGEDGRGKNNELMVIAVFIGCCCLALAYAGIMLNAESKFHLSVTIAVILISVIYMFIRKEISWVVIFFFLRQACHPSMSGATFYFFTDTVKQYPQGPHFSAFFYTTTMGLTGSCCTLLGIYSYARFMRGFRYVKLMVFCNLLFATAGALQILVYTRYNLHLGIPDRAFVLGETVMGSLVGQWMWIPGTVLLSQCCPKGLEATMYALLAGTINLGETLASYNGAYLLKSLHINPDGSPNEGAQFGHIWQGALTIICLSLMTTAILPFFIPNASQTERLLTDNEECAIHNSPWDRWVLRPRKAAGLVDASSKESTSKYGAMAHADSGAERC